MADLIDRKSVIDVIHKALFDFFDIVDDDDESPMTYKDEQLLTLNKAIVTKIQALPSAQPDVPESCVGDMISRQAAINTLIRESHADGAYGYLDAKSINDALKRMPSVDAVEVVRCKDCIHSTEWYRDRRRCFLWNENGISVFEDGFCNYGEQKDG